MPEDTPPPAAGPPIEAAPVAAPEYAVAEDAWTAMLEQQVVVDRADGSEVAGKLVASTEHAVVLVGEDGAVTTVQKADATALRQRTAGEPEAAPEPPKAPAEAAPDDKDTEHPKAPKLGLFTSHGISYSHWRTDAYRDGGATYALDVGAGYNFKENMGIYGVLGGNVGAKLRDSDTRGNLGHFGAMLRYRGKKRFVFLGGVALAWSKLVEPERSIRDVGVAVPMKFMGQFQLKNHMHLGVGVGYQLALFAQRRVANSFSFQVTVARW